MQSVDLSLLNVTLADGAMLVSPWKAALLLLPWVPWAMLVSRVFDKHAQRFYLPQTQWNVAHLVVGLVAPAVALGIPIRSEGAFWIGFGAMIAILGAHIATFVLVTNRDERVPEEHRLRLDFSKSKKKGEERAAAKLQGTVALSIKGPDKQVLAAPTKDTPEYVVRIAAEKVVLSALAARASQVDFTPAPVTPGQQPAYTLSHLIDGVRQSVETIPAANAIKLMDFWKAAGKLDTNERRKRQMADVNVERDSTKTKVRVTSIGGQTGMRVTLLFNPEQAVKRKAEDLGLLEKQLEELKAIAAEERGVVLLLGQPDNGRTTTLYSVLRMHDAYTKNVQSVEMEIQDVLEGARQNVWEATPDGPEFSTLVRSILRRDPDVVGVAEMPDANTAKEVARADADRTRTYLSIRADGLGNGISAYFKGVGDMEQAGKTMHGVVVQKLVRKLCTNCRVAYQPSPDMVKKLGLPPDKVKTLYKKGGQVLIKNKPEVCPMCQGHGYFGQEGLFEVYRLTKEDRALLQKGDLAGLKTEFRKRGLPTMQQVALRKAVEGTTSVEEVMRVTAEGAVPQAPAPAPAQTKA